MFDPANPFGTVMNIDSLLTPNVGSPQFPVSFGEDANGNLYIAYIVTGEVYRIATDAFHPGDFDGDGDVDGADFVVWQTNFPTTSGATLAMGDADGDGDVDGADFVVWQTNFPTPSGGSSPVPEPGTAALALVVVGVIALMRRRA
jgi:MYXO-CTERM domain-containing protein